MCPASVCKRSWSWDGQRRRPSCSTSATPAVHSASALKDTLFLGGFLSMKVLGRPRSRTLVFKSMLAAGASDPAARQGWIVEGRRHPLMVPCADVTCPTVGRYRDPHYTPHGRNAGERSSAFLYRRGGNAAGAVRTAAIGLTQINPRPLVDRLRRTAPSRARMRALPETSCALSLDREQGPRSSGSHASAR